MQKHKPGLFVKDNLSAIAPSPTHFYPEDSGTNVWFALCKQATRLWIFLTALTK